jgi:pimeloyl-ACP methyl ester carboxylesterase
MILHGPHGRLVVDDVGTGEPPVIFVHGNAGSRRHWAAQLDHLAPERRGVAFDLHGFGDSETRAGAEYTPASFADDLHAVVEGCDVDRVVLAGHSLGGAVIAAFAGRDPRRVAGLLFVDSVGDNRGRAAWTEALLDNMAGLDFRDYTRGWFERLLSGAGEHVRNLVLSDLEGTPRDVFIGAVEGLTRFDPAAALESYPGPALHVYHPTINDDPWSLHNVVPRIRARPMTEASHWLMMDRREDFNRLLDTFLDRRDADCG